MNKLLPVSFFTLIPSLAFAHGGPELFIFLWSIALLPAFIATGIAPKGYRVAWLVGGIVFTVSSVMLMGFFFVNGSVWNLMVVPVLLIPGSIIHRVTCRQKPGSHSHH